MKDDKSEDMWKLILTVSRSPKGSGHSLCRRLITWFQQAVKKMSYCTKVGVNWVSSMSHKKGLKLSQSLSHNKRLKGAKKSESAPKGESDPVVSTCNMPDSLIQIYSGTKSQSFPVV